jgi:GT2 family glycosyltransferase
VVDNASTDGSADVAERYAGVTVVRNTVNAGYARAMNQALRGADADVLIALNPDTEPPPGSLTLLVRRLLAAPNVGLVSPRLVNLDGSTQQTAYRFPSLPLNLVAALIPTRFVRSRLGRRLWLEGGSDHHRRVDVDWTIGAVHVLRVEAVDPDTPYIERWFMYVEDLDLCWTLRQQGWRRRLEGDIAVPHHGNASGGQAWGERRAARYLEASHDWYLLRHSVATARLWALINFVGSVRGAAPAAARVLGRGHPRGALELVAGRYRPARVHARALLRGPLPPDPSPPEDLVATPDPRSRRTNDEHR